MFFNSWTLFQLFLYKSVRSLPSPSIARNFGGGLLCKCTRNFFIWELWCLENIVKQLFVFSRCSVGNLRTGRPNGQLLVISNARILCICLPTHLLYEYLCSCFKVTYIVVCNSFPAETSHIYLQVYRQVSQKVNDLSLQF